MSTPLPTGLTPYCTPALLTQAPTGISWSTIPPGNSTPAQQLAEQSNICMRSTAQADTYTNQVLRATLDTEVFRGPDYRMTIQQNGNARIILQRWPVLTVVSVQVAAANVWPHRWTTVPPGMYEPEYAVPGLYGSVAPSAAGEGGQAIIIARSYLSWAFGRLGYIAQVQYINGWPHAGIRSAAEAGATMLQVDDCTGWGITAPFTGVTGATGTVYDSGSQEAVQVTAASAAAGPGVLTLASPLLFPHASGVFVSTLPQSVVWACILFGTAQALTRGATSTTIHAIPGGAGSGGKGPADLTGEAELLLHPFRRTI
jgi:hypothetical protein